MIAANYTDEIRLGLHCSVAQAGHADSGKVHDGFFRGSSQSHRLCRRPSHDPRRSKEPDQPKHTEDGPLLTTSGTQNLSGSLPAKTVVDLRKQTVPIHAI